MYRILDEDEQVRERRNQLRHPNYVKPELLATQPNQLWSWDITKLLGPAKWTYYYLYDIMDVFSRYVVGRLIAEREFASLAEELRYEDHIICYAGNIKFRHFFYTDFIVLFVTFKYHYPSVPVHTRYHLRFQEENIHEDSG
jgi:hypothetical protein